MVVTVETDAGVTGIGEGGSKDTLEQCAGRLIGQDPQLHRTALAGYVERVLLSAGAGKVSMPWARSIWRSGTSRAKCSACRCTQMLGGMVRNYCECYNTAGTIPGDQAGDEFEGARAATIEAGYRAFRMGAADTRGNQHLQHARAAQSA